MFGSTYQITNKTPLFSFSFTNATTPANSISNNSNNKNATFGTVNNKQAFSSFNAAFNSTSSNLLANQVSNLPPVETQDKNAGEYGFVISSMLEEQQQELPNFMSFYVPQLIKNVNISSSTAISSTVSLSSTNKFTPLTDFNVPPILLSQFERFKKHLDECKKTSKEKTQATSTINVKLLQENRRKIENVQQRLTQAHDHTHRNVTECHSECQTRLTKCQRHLDICQYLRTMPAGIQMWNEYFISRLYEIQEKMHSLEIQFEALDDYFQGHKKQLLVEESAQKMVSTLQLMQRNLMIDASALKLVHEHVEELKRRFLVYKKHCQDCCACCNQVDDGIQVVDATKIFD